MPRMRDYSRLPLRPFGKAAGGAADIMDAAAPGVAMLGDTMTDAMSGTLGEAGAFAGSALASGLGSALSAVPVVGPALGAGTGAVGNAVSQVAPRMAAAGSALAMQAPKIMGRMAYQAGSGALRQAEQAAGGSGMGPAMSRALTQRAAMSTGLPSPMGGQPKPEPDMGGDLPPIGTPVGEYPSMPIDGSALMKKHLAERMDPGSLERSRYNPRRRFDADYPGPGKF